MIYGAQLTRTREYPRIRRNVFLIFIYFYNNNILIYVVTTNFITANTMCYVNLLAPRTLYLMSEFKFKIQNINSGYRIRYWLMSSQMYP